MVIDNLGQRLGETLVSHIPIADPGEARAGQARGGIRHLGETQVGRFCEQGGKEGFSIFCRLVTVQMREMPAEVDLLIDLDQQLGNLDPSHFGIRLAGQFFDPFRDLCVQRCDAHFVLVDTHIGQGIVLEQLSDPRQLLMQQGFPLRQIGRDLQRDRYWRRACRLEPLPVLDGQKVLLKLPVLVTPLDPDIAGAQSIA